MSKVKVAKKSTKGKLRTKRVKKEEEEEEDWTPALEWFVGRNRGLQEGAKKNYETGFNMANSFLNAMKYSEGNPMTKKEAGKKKAANKYEKGLSRGFLVRDFDSGLPIEVVPTQEDLFRPRQRYFKAKPGKKGNGKKRLNSRELTRAFDEGANKDIFPPFDIENEFVGQTKAGRKVLITRLTDIPVDDVVRHMRENNPFNKVVMEMPDMPPMITVELASSEDESEYVRTDIFSEGESDDELTNKRSARRKLFDESQETPEHSKEKGKEKVDDVTIPAMEYDEFMTLMEDIVTEWEAGMGLIPSKGFSPVRDTTPVTPKARKSFRGATLM